jgi:hypothetical protein
MGTRSVNDRKRSVIEAAAADTEARGRSGPLRLIALLGRRPTWWTSRKRYTKAALATSFVAFGALIGVLANVLAVWDHLSPKERPAKANVAAASPAVVPLPTCFTCTSGKTFPERVSPSSVGARTFRNPLIFGGEGKRVPPGQRVRVVCRYQQADPAPSVQDGWWYLLASSPWNRQYYSPASSYLNGDPPGGPYLTIVNNGIPVC